MRKKSEPDPIRTAQGLMERHGLRAAAVATEHVSEAQLAGDVAGLSRWRQVQFAIAELRATAHAARPSASRQSALQH
jgi:hypothetical protein